MRTLFLPCIGLMLLSACTAFAPAVSTEARLASKAAMAPHFECALYFNQVNNAAGVTRSLDTAATLGEKSGLSVNEITEVYQNTKRQQNETVLAQAIAFAEQRPNLIPRISGGPPAPNDEEQLRAWNSLYQSKCPAAQ